MTITGNEENKEEMVRPWNKGAGDLRKVWKIIKEDIRCEIQRRNRQYNDLKKKDKNNDPLKHYTLMIEQHKPH